MSAIMNLVPYLGAFFAILVVGIIYARLYTRTSAELAFVRTGMGGKKVVTTGGAIVLPRFHGIIWVNRNTLRLEVKRDGHASLITKDRLRVDVSAEFYVRVAGEADSIEKASQTLGDKTTDPLQLMSLVEGKFVDALRSAAASMTMEELHESRANFVQFVKDAVAKDLSQNGLELEAVSLTGLNQTGISYFAKDNAFDAAGLLKLTQEIQTRLKAQNDIEQDTAVAIETKNLAATQQSQALRKQREEVTLTTDQSIAEMTANQKAAVAATMAAGRRREEEATLEADQQVAQRRIDAERVVGEAEAAKKQAVKTADITSETAVRLAAQAQNITVANRSKDEAAAQAAADLARADAVKAEESVVTARQVAAAERQKEVTLVRADEKAREESIGILVAAEAEKAAATNRADAQRELAKGGRDAAMLQAEAITAEGAAKAGALEQHNKAQNLLSPEAIAQQIKLQLLQVLPAIIAESVKPMANIDSIRIAEVGGLHGGQGGTSGSTAQAGGLGNEMVNAALRYRSAQPVIDGLMADVGLKGGGDMQALLGSAAQMAGVSLATADAAPVVAPAPVAVVPAAVSFETPASAE